MLKHYRSGKTPDNVLMALQNFYARRQESRCFGLSPCLVQQRRLEPSTTCSQEQWSAAMKASSKQRAVCLPTKAQGVKKLTKKNLRCVRQTVGAAGGRRHAGSGSTAAMIRSKKRLCQRYFQRYQIFPSKRFAYSEYGVSQKLWQRFRRELCQ